VPRTGNHSGKSEPPMNWRMYPLITESIWEVIRAKMDGGEPNRSAIQKQSGQLRADWRLVTLSVMPSCMGFPLQGWVLHFKVMEEPRGQLKWYWGGEIAPLPVELEAR